MKGPDFYEFFSKHTDHLSDGVHPDSEGYEMMRELWAKTMFDNVYSVKSAETTVPVSEKKGFPATLILTDRSTFPMLCL